MADFKAVLGFKNGKCVQRELKDADALIGKKVGEQLKGEEIGLEGYEFEITGGSDDSGFPMRKDIPGNARKRILAVSGVGLKKKRRGMRQRKTVRGNTIGEQTAQINLKVLKQGKENFFEEKKEEAPAEGKAEEAKPAEEKKEEPKEAPKEDKKE